MSDPQKPPIDRAQRATIIGVILIAFFGVNAIYGMISHVFSIDIPGVQWFKHQPIYLAVSWFGFGLGLGAYFCGTTLRVKPSPSNDPS